MLVGDRGRVIPFRHFKGIALGVCCVSFLFLVAFIVMSFLYIGQGKKISDLEDKLEKAQLQNSKLRDEKDLYLTKLMVTQKQEKAAALKEKALDPPEAKTEAPQPEPAKPAAEDPAPDKKKEAPSKPPEVEVDWKADVRRFSVSYDPKREVLNAQFRVYNTSKPKKQLTGRSVVVFKVPDDPPVKWMPVPRMPLIDGEPKGTQGRQFRVNNYITMKFRAYHQKAPVAYNTASVFVFSQDGRILANKDFAFKIKTPPPPPKPQPAPQPPAAEKKPPEPAPVPAADIPAPKPADATSPVPPAGQEGSGSGPPSPAPGSGQVPAATPQPVAPIQTPEAGSPTDSVVTPPSSEPPAGTPDIPDQTETPPATDQTVTAPQPPVEGEAK